MSAVVSNQLPRMVRISGFPVWEVNVAVAFDPITIAHISHDFPQRKSTR